jgi:guanylate kinase
MAELKHYQEFKDILETYHLSERAKQVLENLKLVLMVAPTSGGKNTVIQRKLESGRYYYIVSDTTRPPRNNNGVMEQDGREYWFRTEEAMLANLKAGNYLEAELIHNQQVSGISIGELEKAQSQGKIAITDVDPQGVHNIVKAKPDTCVVMLLPPSYDEWQKRLSSRGVMRPDEQKRRLETAARLLQDGLDNDFYHFVITENIDQSAAIIDAIVEGKSNPHQGRGREVIQQLLSRLRDAQSNIY